MYRTFSKATIAITCMLVAALNAAVPSAMANEGEGVHRVESAADFEHVMRDRFITAHDESPGLRLARSWLIASEKGFSSRRRIHLSDTTHVRKTFDLPHADVEGADLYIYHGGGTPDAPMIIKVNGQRIEHTDAGMVHRRGWRRQPIPGDALEAGRNTFILSGNGRVVDDARSPTVGSAVSHDGGESWHPTQGELILRLRVRGHAPQGTITSPVIDAGRALASDRAIGPWPTAGEARIDLSAQTPSHTSVEVMWRAGNTPQFDRANWTPWQSGAHAQGIDARYFQWRVKLRTDAATRTPVVRAVTTSFSARSDASPPAWLKRVGLAHVDEPERRESSYAFEHETDSPRVRHLRETADLSSVIAEGQDDLEATTAIRRWVSRQWRDGWNSGTYRYVPPWDSLILLEMAPRNLSLGMCTHYATLYVQSSVAVGYVSRHVIVHSHALAETFLNDRGQWILQDPGPGAGPDGYPIGVRFERDGEPLNALDMHRAHAAGDTDVTEVPHADEGEPNALDPEGSNLGLYRRFGIPLRNNHLSVPEPAEEEHGQDHYRFDGYLWWAQDLDDPYENVAYFSLVSNRPADFYPSVNATRIELDAAATEHVLDVDLWGTTPHVQAYEVSVDGEEWRRASVPFEWALNAGENTLRARAVNAFGRTGPVSSVTVVLDES